MNNMIKKLAIALLFFSGVADAGKWPMITSLKTVKEGGEWHYYITQSVLEIGPSVDVYKPSRTIVLTHRHNPNTNNQIGRSEVGAKTSSTETISQTAVKLFNSSGSSVPYATHTGASPTNSECVAYVVSAESNEPNPNAHGNWANVFAPGGCLMIPPADEWCKITTPEILFEHGTIKVKDAEGSSVSAQMRLQCTNPTAVTFNLVTGDKYVYLDDGKAEIIVNNMPMKTKIDLPEGDSTLPIKDLLTGVTKEGFHTGSSVLVMMPY